MLTWLWAAQLSRGELGAAASTLLLTVEDSPATTIRPRLEALGADLERVHFAGLRRQGIDAGLALPENIADLRELIERTGARLVVVDPAGATTTAGYHSSSSRALKGSAVMSITSLSTTTQ